ncbi:RAMP superfamily CRISPR-associated protein [Synechococcus sp. PCC 7336]|uniref:RAMP superfamily CRISPR-associated protein n=1 Tax=Synechococcus sp. PCC 7336 TaxID=195250 RepID=UPI00034D7012|nr:RAMP superfamily CRISPR-associated protein [Synechococcus sp. PCC 7336]
MLYTGPKLVELLARQEQARGRNLVRQGEFKLQWRAKAGSYPHPDLETMISAGEASGAWLVGSGLPQDARRPEGKRNVGENWESLHELPINGYIPAASIRGLVRAWAAKRSEIEPKMLALLGHQDKREIVAGKIQFLDAWPLKATRLSLDIVNPQQQFQVYHEGQGTPLSLYTLGDGEQEIVFRVAIRGLPGKVTADDVEEVWGWVQQALLLNGVGSRTASGYGAIAGFGETHKAIEPNPGWEKKRLTFSLYSQGCAGPDTQTMELRPSHWRGWLRSWMMRLLLGVMSHEDAQITLAELMGEIEPNAVRGLIRLEMHRGGVWGQRSSDSPRFYGWQGHVDVHAPSQILESLVVPVIRIGNSVCCVGRGGRRPLHVFRLDNGYEAARGGFLNLTHVDREKTKQLVIPPEAKYWKHVYSQWESAVRKRWPQRFSPERSFKKAEVFSPNSCAVYLVPGPPDRPLDLDNFSWRESLPERTRGAGIDLIYNPQYKRKNDVGGSAGNGGAYCSWVSIRRMPTSRGPKEVVCLFLGADNALRQRFLQDLASIDDARHLFGVSP